MNNSSNIADWGRHNRIHFYLDGDKVTALEAKLAPGQTLDDLCDAVLGDGQKWLETRDRIRNRGPVTLDDEPDAPDLNDLTPTQPLRGDADPLAAPAPKRQRLRCKCCDDGCQCPWVYRGTTRCGCTPERLEYLRTHGDYLK